MSERPKWMPSSSEIGLASSFDEERWIDYPKTKDLIRRTGLRAQVAVLEELVSESRSEPCLSALITHKIITLRKEIDG